MLQWHLSENASLYLFVLYGYDDYEYHPDEDIGDTCARKFVSYSRIRDFADYFIPVSGYSIFKIDCKSKVIVIAWECLHNDGAHFFGSHLSLDGDAIPCEVIFADLSVYVLATNFYESNIKR